MNRLYTPSEYRSVVEHMRELFDHAVFTTDVIVGFPGETDADFEESMRFVQSLRFLKVHVFSYSRRPGTVAAEMPQQVDEQIKAQRSKAMIAAADAVRAEVIHEFEGYREEVLLERPISKSSFTGYTKSYIPVVVAAPGYRSGDIIPVTVGEFDGQRCVANLAE